MKPAADTRIALPLPKELYGGCISLASNQRANIPPKPLEKSALPLFLNDAIPQEHKDSIDIARDFLRRAHVLVVCGDTVDEAMKNDIAIAERLRITATTLDGLLTVKGQGREKGGNQHG